MNIIGNRKLTGTIKGNIPELTVLPQIHCNYAFGSGFFFNPIFCEKLLFKTAQKR